MTDSNNAAGTVLPGEGDRRQAVLYKKTILKSHTHSAGSLKMHSTLIRVSAIIINNIISAKPFSERKNLKEEVDIGFDGRTCQRKRNAGFLKTVHKCFRTGHQMKHLRMIQTSLAIQRFFFL